MDAFESAYGPKGDWVRLFRKDSKHISTCLVRDRQNPARFLTIDFWSSYEACTSFRERFLEEYEELDRQFARFTLEEVRIGDFDVLGEWEPKLLNK